MAFPVTVDLAMPLILRLAVVLLLGATVTTAQPLYGLTSCCPNTAVVVDAQTGLTTPVAEVGGADDLFTASIGTAAVDAASRRAVALRNGRLIRVGIDGGEVEEGPAAPWYTQAAGVDGDRGVLYAFATERDTVSFSPLDVRVTNRIVRVEISTFDTTHVAVAGRARIVEMVDADGRGQGTVEVEGDTFSPVAGPALVAGRQMHTVRNGELVSVDLERGSESLGPSFPYGAEVVAAGEGSVYLLVREQEPIGGGVRGTLRLAQTAAGSGSATPLAVLGTWTVRETTGRDGEAVVEGDAFAAGLGLAVYDETAQRVFVRRNDRLISVDVESGEAVSGPELASTLRLVGTAASSVSAGEGTPDDAFSLRASPSPALGTVTISFVAPDASVVAIEVFDTAGRLVRQLAGASLPSGATAVEWDRSGVPAGVYLVRLSQPGASRTTSVVLVR